MDDISTLQIRVLSADVQSATSRLTALENQAGRTERATDKFTKSATASGKGMLGAAAGFLSFAAAVRAVNEVLSNVKAYQVTMANLTTATGSVENATEAYKALQKIAATTPFSLEDVNKAFIKLTNYGLTPSERAIRSYGDAAAATSKNVVDMVEAVADAVNGEFERTKEQFNVKSKNMGDTIEMRFRGVKEVVKNNAKDIEEYFIRIGEVNFAGAMERQMNTLAGTMSNLGDNWDQLMITIGNQGPGTIAQETLAAVAQAVQDLDAYIKSGAASQDLDTWAVAWAGWGEAARGSITAVGTGLGYFVDTSHEMMLGFNEDVDDYGIHSWGDFLKIVQLTPAAFETMAAAVGTTLQGLSMKITALGNQVSQGLLQKIQQLGESATYDNLGMSGANFRGANGMGGATGSMSNDALNQASWEKTKGDLADLNADTKFQLDLANENIATGLDAEIDALMRISDKQDTLRRESADSAKKFADGMVLPPKDGATDPLAKFAVGGGDTSMTQKPKKGGGGGGGGKSEEDKAKAEFERLQTKLQGEEEAIAASYDRRKALIDKFTEDGSKAELDLSLELINQWEEESQAKIDKDKKSVEHVWEALEAEEQLIKDSYERRKNVILEATSLTESEKLKLLAAAQQEYVEKIQKNSAETNDKYLGAAKTFFGNLASIGSAFGEKGFKIAKAAAIAEATVNTYSAAVNAYKSLSGIPYVGPALGAVAAGAAIAAGMANIAQIKAQQYSAGSYADGGIVPGGSYSGDRMNIKANSGEMILTRSQQSSLFNMVNGSSPKGGVNVNIINNAGVRVNQSSNENGGGIDLQFILEATEKHMAESVDKGGTPFARMLENRYPIARGTRR